MKPESRERAKYILSSESAEDVVKGLIDDRECFLRDLERIGLIMKSNKSDAQKLKEVYQIAEFWIDDDEE